MLFKKIKLVLLLLGLVVSVGFFMQVSLVDSLYADDDDDDGWGEYFGDDDDDIEEYLNNKRTVFRRRSPEVEPVKDELYIQECGDCHFVYSRGMLPEKSWRKLMTEESLADHFEEVIELEEEDRSAILNYLVANSAEKSKYKISRKINGSIRSSETPISVSKVRYIRKQHEDIPDQYVTRNAKVLSLSQCGSCHQRADKGIMDEDEIYIPYEAIAN